MKIVTRCGLTLLTFGIVAGCGAATPEAEAPGSFDMQAPATPRKHPVSDGAPQVDPKLAAPTTLDLEFAPKSGSALTGRARLTQTREGVRVQLELKNVKPGDHAAHVHEKGDCSAADASSAGEHFNPSGHAHGLPTASERHVGDMGNLNADKDGEGILDIVLERANLTSDDAASLLGRSIVVHEKLDDGGQPSGNAGGRIGCVEIPK